jgi:hypothetical protein
VYVVPLTVRVIRTGRAGRIFPYSNDAVIRGEYRRDEMSNVNPPVPAAVVASDPLSSRPYCNEIADSRARTCAVTSSPGAV